MALFMEATWRTTNKMPGLATIFKSILTLMPLLIQTSQAKSGISDDLVVKTGKGKIQGFESTTSNGKKVSAWYSIPYAQPPVGNLRFRHPRPMDSWEGTKNTLDSPNSCVQADDTMWPGFSGSAVWGVNTNKSEDCLYLNVVVPRPHPKDAAVILWIYGGGFWSGTTTLELYDLRAMAAEENIIMVGIQYRVASLAFLYFDTEDVPGNAGMFDQLMAIQWVKDNIARFGGNPENITLMGESAGAASVSLHLLSPLSRNLFSQAIMQSASALAPWAVITKRESMLRGFRLAELMNCPHDAQQVRKTIDCLRKADAQTLVDSEFGGITHGFTGSIGIFVPIIDGSFLDETPDSAMRLGNFKKCNILLGSNKDEGNYFVLYYFPDMFPRKEDVFVSRLNFTQTISAAYPNLNKVQQAALQYEYTNWIKPDDPVENRDAVDKYTGDHQFTCPVVDWAHRYAETGNNVYMFHFMQQATITPWPKWVGTMHADEIAFVFGQPLNLSYQYTQKEVALSKQMMSYWANFAKTGNPSLTGSGRWTDTYWPLHTPLKREILTLSAEPSVILEGHRVRKCAFWKKFLPQLAQDNAGAKRPSGCGAHCCSSGASSSSSRSSILITAPLLLLLLLNTLIKLTPNSPNFIN